MASSKQFRFLFYLLKKKKLEPFLHPATKNVSPQNKKCSIKKSKGIKPFYATYINTYTSNEWSTLLSGSTQPASWAWRPYQFLHFCSSALPECSNSFCEIWSWVESFSSRMVNFCTRHLFARENSESSCPGALTHR
jgi:hypothetical protein